MSQAVHICPIILALLLGACCHQLPINTASTQAYFGETASFGALTAAVDQNAAKIPSLWARVSDFQGWLVDPKKQVTYVSGEGHVLYQSPTSLRLILENEDHLYDLFDMGSNSQTFWVHLKHTNQFFWGNLRDTTMSNDLQGFIGPESVLAILGISPITPAPGNYSLPTMTFINDEDVYAVMWYQAGANRLLPTKQVWYDRKTYQPKRVFLYDGRGRAVIQAWLSEYTQINLPNIAPQLWPTMATQFRVLLAENGTQTSFRLQDIALSHNDKPDADTFTMPALDELREEHQDVQQIGTPVAP